jgi:hypothetical protein
MGGGYLVGQGGCLNELHHQYTAVSDDISILKCMLSMEGGWVGRDVGVDCISRGRDRCLVSSLRNVEIFLRAEWG